MFVCNVCVCYARCLQRIVALFVSVWHVTMFTGVSRLYGEGTLNSVVNKYK